MNSISNTKIIFKGGDLNKNKPMTWRFESIDNTEVEINLSRDTDTRFLLREKLAVDEWIKSDKIFQIFFHDPRFFFFSLNPLSLPMINLKINMPDLIPDTTINASTGFKPIVQQWIYAVKNVKYNRGQAPCIEDINYSFTSCIIDHIVKSTNCTVSQLQ